LSTRFNPPPAWRTNLPAGFTPDVAWTPERAWGAPPVGWPMWIDDATGLAADPPIQYAQNPYLFMSVMPDFDAENNVSSGLSQSKQEAITGKKRLSRGKKIGLGVASGIVVVMIIAALGGGDDGEGTLIAGASASPTEVAANAEIADEPVASPSKISEAEESANAAAAEKAVQEKAAASSEAAAEEEAKAEAEKKAEEEAKAKAEKEAKASEKAEAEAAAKAEEEAGTVSQQNALGKASDYLEYTAFSKSGLVDQLEFEGFSKGDATWAVEQLNVDWNEQAALKAADYLDYSSFSKSGLIDQLMFEGFTKKQATYGVGTTGL